MNTYKMTIAGCERELPICKINDNLSIAAFIMLGDVEITESCAQELLRCCPAFDAILTAETKGIPLAYEMAKLRGTPYVVARKSQKLYMQDPTTVKLKSITTEKEQTLYLSKSDMELLNGKNVLIVDDVISTGESLLAMEKLAEAAECNVVGKAAVLAEGDASMRGDIIFLEALPLFTK